MLTEQDMREADINSDSKSGFMPGWLAVGAAVAMALPFLGKGFDIDDPLFIRAARRILEDPLDFYGFAINWYGTKDLFHEVMQNPPLFSYYLAGWGGIFGFSEAALRLGVLVWTVLAGAGVCKLAARMTLRPGLAAGLTLLAPVAVLCSGTVMCDMALLALWIWAAVFWRGWLDSGRAWRAALGLACVAMAGLTKYFGLALVPLLAVQAMTRPGRRWSGLLMAAPVLVWTGFELWTAKMYGHGLISSAMGYCLEAGSSIPARCVEGLAFTGGCFAPLVLLLGRPWGRRRILILAGLCLAAILAARFRGEAAWPRAGTDFVLAAHLGVMAVLGGAILWLSAASLLRGGKGDDLFLGLWLFGTLIFCVGLNWTVSGRNILLMGPPLAVLAARSLDREGAGPAGKRAAGIFCLAVCVVLGLSLSWSDQARSEGWRQGADELAARFPERETLAFQGHWGFQHYMARYGFEPFDLKKPVLRPGLSVVLPLNNPNVVRLNPELFKESGRVVLKSRGPASVMQSGRGAGFYSSLWGPVPYVLVPQAQTEYRLFKLEPSEK